MNLLDLIQWWPFLQKIAETRHPLAFSSSKLKMAGDKRYTNLIINGNNQSFLPKISQILLFFFNFINLTI